MIHNKKALIAMVANSGLLKQTVGYSRSTIDTPPPAIP
jgi:hypothetical protein